MKKIVGILLLLFVGIFCFVACDNNGDTDEKNHEDNSSTIVDEKKPTTITLNKENFNEYFTLQQEILAYNEQTYMKTIDNNPPTTVQFRKITQTTKVSIILLKEKMRFNNVAISLSPSGWSQYWKGNGTLYVSYDGSGFTTILGTYDTFATSSITTLSYIISNISGTITITE